jgi:hypothetical protein
MANPSKLESRMRRSALPTVMPKPGSNGRNSKRPENSEESNITTLSGFWKSRIAMFDEGFWIT